MIYTCSSFNTPGSCVPCDFSPTYMYIVHSFLHSFIPFLLQGFNDIFPLKILQVFDERELEVCVCNSIIMIHVHIHVHVQVYM